MTDMPATHEEAKRYASLPTVDLDSKRVIRYLLDALATAERDFQRVSDENDRVCAMNDQLSAQLRVYEEALKKLESAIKWALGEEGEFGEEPPPLAGKYRQRFWWRTELRKRAVLASPDPLPGAPQGDRSC